MKKHCFLSVFLLLLTALADAQTAGPKGVYIGAELYNTPFNGMQIDHIVLYFRNDGKFNDQLDKADWKTAVSGSYAVKNGMVVLTYTSGGEAKQYKLAANGNLESTAGIKHTLHKIKKVNSLPAAMYQRRTAAYSGGIGAGVPGVFAGSSDFLYFDGKGHFLVDRSSITAIAGDVAGGTVGGKFERNGAPAGGTYQLGDGELTLTWSNGTVATHSFFYSPPNEEDMIVLDGSFYFREEGMVPAQQPGAAAGTARKSSTPATKTDNTPKRVNPAADAGLPDAATLLNKLRSNYGGDNIDKINTLRETATLTGNLKVVMITDIINNKVRVEMRQDSKLMLVRQLTGTEGWQWVNGVNKPLTGEEKAEMLLNRYQGVLGLHKKLSAAFASGTVTESKGDYMLTFVVNGKKVVYLTGSDYTLKTNGYSVNGALNFSVYKHFGKTAGVTWPDVTESSDGTSTITVTTTALEVNPVLTADTWKKP